MNKLMKKGVITTMAAAMFFGLFGGVVRVSACNSNWHEVATLKNYCSTPICNYAAGGLPYRYKDIKYERNCVTDMTGEAYKEYKTETINSGCC